MVHEHDAHRRICWCYFPSVHAQSFSHVQLFVIPQTVACPAPVSMRFPRQEYWSESELPFCSPGGLPDPGIKPTSPALEVILSCWTTWKAHSVTVVQSLSCVRLFETPWTEGRQAPLSMEFSRQEYWSGLPVPSPGDLPDPEIKPGIPALQADSLLSEPAGKLWWCC